MKTKLRCRAEGCEKLEFSRSLCKAHYAKDRRADPIRKAATKEKYMRKFRTPRGRLNIASGSAKKRLLEWAIDLEQYEKLVLQNCSYCNTSIDAQTGSGLDRIDCSRGYTLDNVIPCCGDCNRLRGDTFTVKETYIMVQALQKYRNGIKNKQELKKIKEKDQYQLF